MNAAEFKKQFLPLHSKLYRIAFRMVENQEDAEDILQDTYGKLWKKRSYMQGIDNREAFAMAVLKNTCLDFLKRSKSHLLSIEEVQIEDEQSASIRIESENIRSFIQSAIERLPKQQRQVFQLYYRDGFTMQEIGNLTGLNYKNIKVILSRTRKQIKEYGQNLDLI